ASFPVNIYPVGSLSAALTFSQGVAQATPRGGGLPSFLAPTPPPTEETCCANLFENDAVLCSVFPQGGRCGIRAGEGFAARSSHDGERERTMYGRNTE
ncbi:hypothetical protein CEXT_244371, partial [Caerostris extrusa]